MFCLAFEVAQWTEAFGMFVWFAASGVFRTEPEQRAAGDRRPRARPSRYSRNALCLEDVDKLLQNRAAKCLGFISPLSNIYPFLFSRNLKKQNKHKAKVPHPHREMFTLEGKQSKTSGHLSKHSLKRRETHDTARGSIVSLTKAKHRGRLWQKPVPLQSSEPSEAAATTRSHRFS